MAEKVITIPVASARAKTITLQEQGYRRFEITSAQEVEAPGLLSIDELVFGWNQGGHHSETPIPRYSEFEVPVDTTESRYQTIRFENWARSENQDGVAVVIRGANSNDGNWQVGGFLLIKGQWVDETARVAATGKK